MIRGKGVLRMKRVELHYKLKEDGKGIISRVKFLKSDLESIDVNISPYSDPERERRWK